MLFITFRTSNGDIIVTFIHLRHTHSFCVLFQPLFPQWLFNEKYLNSGKHPVISPNLFCLSTCSSFVSALRLPSVPPSICPSIHVQYTSLGVIIVSKKDNVFCFQNGTHYFSLSTSCQNYSLILHITTLHIPPILSFSSSSASPIIGLPTYVCFSVSWPDIQETSNHFLNMFLEFKTAQLHLLGSFPWINRSWHKHSEWLKRHMAEQL